MPLPVGLQETLVQIGRGAAARQFESEVLDFKEVGPSPKVTFQTIADAVVCFTNGRGGTLVLGVADKATTRPAAFPGVDASITVDTVRKAIFDRTRPAITVAAEDHLEDGVRLVVMVVAQGIAPHSNTAGLATRRLGIECLPFTPEQQREVLRARGQLDWSAESSGVALERLSQAELERMRRLLSEAGRDEIAGLRDGPLLESMRLLADDRTVTWAGLLLLGSSDLLRDALPAHGYSYQYRPTPGSEAASRFRGNRPLLSAVETLLEAVNSRAEMMPLNVAGGIQIPLVDYPANAVREVVVNALIHRSFDGVGSVDIEQSPERFEVTSPGGLVAGVTPENILTHPSTPRHQLLAEAVAFVQLAERTGQGIDRAYREMLRAGKEPPTIEDSGLAVQAILAGGIGNDAFVRFVRDLPDRLSGDVEVLIALSLLRTSTSVDAFKLAALIQRTPAQGQDVLARLADDSVRLLEPTRRTLRKPYPVYRLRNEPLAMLARAVSYRRRTLDETDAKVVEHVREYGFITNRTLQRLFDRELYGARNMLSDLRERGILEKLGTARGGPGVKYGPGPKFPKRKLRGPEQATDAGGGEDTSSVPDQLSFGEADG